LIDKKAKVEDLVNAVKYLTPEKCISMRYECEYRAKDFSLEKFEEKLKNYV